MQGDENAPGVLEFLTQRILARVHDHGRFFPKDQFFNLNKSEQTAVADLAGKNLKDLALVLENYSVDAPIGALCHCLERTGAWVALSSHCSLLSGRPSKWPHLQSTGDESN